MDMWSLNYHKSQRPSNVPGEGRELNPDLTKLFFCVSDDCNSAKQNLEGQKKHIQEMINVIMLYEIVVSNLYVILEWIGWLRNKR